MIEGILTFHPPGIFKLISFWLISCIILLYTKVAIVQKKILDNKFC